MYHAKRRPRAFALYEGGMDAGALERLRLAGELERALERDELVLHFQPIADARTGAIASAEALVRWEHPSRGLLYPGAFLPALERTTLSHRFSRKVLELAVGQTVRFRAAGRPLRVAVNLTPSDVLDAGLPDEVATLLVRHRAQPEDLVLEVTESGVLSDFDRARDVIERVRALGVKVALDDFGTGHSSLTHLQRLPVDVLKIDRSFVAGVVTDPATAAIVRSMLELAHTLGQRVVAEGVEDGELWRRLAGWGCDFAQGWIVGPAVPAGELVESFPKLVDRARRAAGRPPLHVVA
jgi:EAL domain-containing protein (putative c-di-GMP-specific phosphodiesterase class I)